MSRLARRWYHARYEAYPDWRTVLSTNRDLWESAKKSAEGGPRVLMATAIGSYAHAITLESALAAALTFRGAEVHALLCDGSMTACAECEASLYPDLARFAARGPAGDLCRDCQWPAERVYSDLGIVVHRLGDWLRPEDRGEARAIATDLPVAAIETFVFDGLAIGEHAYAGALRFFASGSLADEPSLAGAACATNVRYVYSGRTISYEQRRLPSLAALEQTPGLNQVFRLGTTAIFEVDLPCPPA
jgi:hypothetical protein